MLHPVLIEHIVGLYEDVTKSREVAERCGVNHVTVLRHVRAQGKPVRRRGRPSNPDRDPILRRRR